MNDVDILLFCCLSPGIMHGRSLRARKEFEIFTDDDGRLKTVDRGTLSRMSSICVAICVISNDKEDVGV